MVRIKGATAILRDLNRLPGQVQTLLKDEAETAGRAIEAKAKTAAPVDWGKLCQSIIYEVVRGGFGALVAVGVPYGPYVEFGTGGRVEIPDGWDEVAATFKGSGKRTVNLTARPFLIPAYLVEREKYLAAVDNGLKRLLR